MTSMIEFKEAMKIIDDVIIRTADYDCEAFLSVIAMLMEEYCSKNGLDMIESARMVYEAAIEVNAILGQYPKRTAERIGAND